MTFSAGCVTSVRFWRHRSTGKERDTESGNDYFGARYYASSMGRFLSPDWSAKAEPVPYAKLDNPQSLNLYAYVRNNPLIRIDADGHTDWCAGSGAGSLACGVQTNWNQVHGIVSDALNKAGSYVYGKGFKGSGDEIKVKFGPVKLEAGHEEGTEETKHLNGEHEVKKIKSDWHFKAEFADASAGFERTVSGDQSHPEWQFTYGYKDLDGSGGQVGVGVHPCFGESCNGFEVGVEAGRMWRDFSTWLKNNPPDPNDPIQYIGLR